MLDVNIDTVTITDIKRNLDFLLSKRGGFTREDIAMCPMVLAHPRKKVVLAVKHLRWQIENVLNSNAMSVRKVEDSKLSDSRFQITDGHITRKTLPVPAPRGQFLLEGDRFLYNKIIEDPKLRVNAVQYFLEKDNNFMSDSSLEQEDANIDMTYVV